MVVPGAIELVADTQKDGPCRPLYKSPESVDSGIMSAIDDMRHVGPAVVYDVQPNREHSVRVGFQVLQGVDVA